MVAILLPVSCTLLPLLYAHKYVFNVQMRTLGLAGLLVGPGSLVGSLLLITSISPKSSPRRSLPHRDCRHPPGGQAVQIRPRRTHLQRRRFC